MKKQRMGVWVAGTAVAAAAVLAGCSSTSTTATGAPAATNAPGSTAAPGTSPTTAGTTPKGTTKPTGTTPGSTVGGGSEFCTQIKAADDMSKTTSGSTKKDKPTQQDIQDFTDALAAARDAGPDEAKAPLRTLITAYEKYAAIADDPAADEKSFEIFLNDEVMNAGAELETVVKAECGFEIQTGGSSGTTDGTSPSPSALPSDDSPTSVSSVKAAVEAKAGNLSWAPAINEGSWGYSGDGTTYDWTIEASSSGRELTADGAFDACTLIADHLSPLQPSFSIQIRTSDGKILAEKLATGTTCKKV